MDLGRSQRQFQSRTTRGLTGSAGQLKSHPSPPHRLLRDYVIAHNIDMEDFHQWFDDAGYGEDEADIHDSRYLSHLETFVEERDSEG